jgi:hypothetical protein
MIELAATFILGVLAGSLTLALLAIRRLVRLLGELLEQLTILRIRLGTHPDRRRLPPPQ